MHDQANDLRKLVRRGTVPVSAVSLARPKLVVVSGAKGGVGTTTIAVNLAVALAQMKHRTLLVDADPNGGDAAMLCHIEPRRSVADVLSARHGVRDVLEPGPLGLQLLPGVWGTDQLVEPSVEGQGRLIEQLRQLGSYVDTVVLDSGNGLGPVTRRFWQVADVVLLVTTPEPASVMDAYASVKVLSAGKGSAPIGTVMNMVRDASVANEAHSRLARACFRFLGIHLSSMGHLSADPEVAAAGTAGKPPATSPPGWRVTQEIQRLAKTTAAMSNQSLTRQQAPNTKESPSDQPAENNLRNVQLQTAKSR